MKTIYAVKERDKRRVYKPSILAIFDKQENAQAYADKMSADDANSSFVYEIVELPMQTDVLSNRPSIPLLTLAR